MATLAEYQAEAQAIIDAMDAEGFDAGELADAVAEWLRADGGPSAKLDAYAAVIAEREHYAAIRKAEAARLSGLARTDQSRADWMRARLLDFMVSTRTDRTETDLHKFSVCANGGKRRVEVTDAAALPAQYWQEVVTRDPDMDAVRDALESGTDVPGAVLHARGSHVAIR